MPANDVIPASAVVVLSDNTAGNLLFRILGGPEGLTRFCRSLDDRVTRLDRTEPTLNSAIPGDDRDTTSPRVMVANMRRILLGNTLSAASRQRLETWLIDDKVGGNRLRAGIPSTWRIGDKTGSGENGTANTIGVLWPPGSSPILVAVYYTGSMEPRDRLNTVHAEIGRLVHRFHETNHLRGFTRSIMACTLASDSWGVEGHASVAASD